MILSGFLLGASISLAVGVWVFRRASSLGHAYPRYEAALYVSVTIFAFLAADFFLWTNGIIFGGAGVTRLFSPSFVMGGNLMTEAGAALLSMLLYTLFVDSETSAT